MEETIYDLVDTFYNYENIFQGITSDDKDGFSNKCKSLFQKNLRDTSVFFTENYCIKYMKYLKELKIKSAILEISYGCKYLYYKIYLDMFKDKNFNYTPQTFYKKFLESIRDDVTLETCNDYLDYDIDVILEKMEKLIELYKILFDEKLNEDCNCVSKCVTLYNDYLKLCRSDNDHEFCNELEKFRYIYKDRVASLNCAGAPKTLESTKPFDAFVILLPFTIILISTFILFILYKFTGIGPLLRLQMRKKKYKSSNLGQQMNTMQQTYGNISGKSGNKTYKISYPSVGS
ncbi:PIR protein [Plasmodium vivax]|nr:PIR protein [Plasmodium vivax]